MSDHRHWFWLPQADAGGNAPSNTDQLPWGGVGQVTRLLCSGHNVPPWLDANFVESQNHFAATRMDEALLQKVWSILQLGKTSGDACYILGTSSFDEAVSASWDAYGLNLFDLPWDLTAQRNAKVIRYVPVLHLCDLLDSVLHDIGAPCEAKHVERVMQQLRWGICHRFNRRVRSAVGHGQADRLQIDGVEKIQTQLFANCRLPDSAQLPCGVRCQLRAELDSLQREFPTSRDGLAQRVSELGCRDYRIAPLLDAIPEFGATGKPFNRVVILEDSEEVRVNLKERLVRLGFADESNVVFAVTHESIERGRLVSDKGVRLLDSEDGRGTLVCFDLELEGAKAGDRIPDGLRILYRERCDHHDVCMMIISGYRSQQLRGLGLRAGSFLLKPFTDWQLKLAVEQARSAHRRDVVWIYSAGTKLKDEEYFGRQFGFHHLEHSPHKLLADDFDVRVEEVEADVDRVSVPVDADLCILDFAPLGSSQVDVDKARRRLCHFLGELRAVETEMPVVIVWPMGAWRALDETLFGSLRRDYRCGHDRVLYKPFWINNPAARLADSLLPTVRSALASGPSFEVKFTVPLPIAPLLGRFDWRYVTRVSSIGEEGETTTPGDEFWTPFLTPLVKGFGFATSVGELRNLARVGDQFRRRLEERVCDEITQNPARWRPLLRAFGHDPEEGAPSKEVQERIRASLSQEGSDAKSTWAHTMLRMTVERFCRWLGSKESEEVLAKHVTLECWARHVCAPKLDAVCKDVFRLFGGDTRYELYARGRWLDNESGKRMPEVEDLLVVVDFLANLAVVSREFVRESLVQPMLKKLGEDAVLVSETPVRASLEFSS